MIVYTSLSVFLWVCICVTVCVCLWDLCIYVRVEVWVELVFMFRLCCGFIWITFLYLHLLILSLLCLHFKAASCCLSHFLPQFPTKQKTIWLSYLAGIHSALLEHTLLLLFLQLLESLVREVPGVHRRLFLMQNSRGKQRDVFCWQTVLSIFKVNKTPFSTLFNLSSFPPLLNHPPNCLMRSKLPAQESCLCDHVHWLQWRGCSQWSTLKTRVCHDLASPWAPAYNGDPAEPLACDLHYDVYIWGRIRMCSSVRFWWQQLAPNCHLSFQLNSFWSR